MKCHPRGTTVFQDLARLPRQPDWTPRAVDLFLNDISTPAQWWEYHRKDVEAAVKLVVEGMRKDG